MLALVRYWMLASCMSSGDDGLWRLGLARDDHQSAHQAYPPWRGELLHCWGWVRLSA